MPALRPVFAALRPPLRELLFDEGLAKTLRSVGPLPLPRPLCFQRWRPTGQRSLTPNARPRSKRGCPYFGALELQAACFER